MVLVCILLRFIDIDSIAKNNTLRSRFTLIKEYSMSRFASFIVVFCFLSISLSAQAGFATNVRTSNDDPAWGETIRIDYTAPDTSRFAKAEFRDTLFCAALISTVWGPRNAVVPMKRKQGTAEYSADLTVPDSALMIRIEICVPYDRAPNGITIFTAKQPGGRKTPGAWINNLDDTDSALALELRDYPTHYEVYISALNAIGQRYAQKGETPSDSLRFSYIDHFLNELQSVKVKNLSWYATVAAVTRQYPDNDAKADGILKEGIEKCEGDEFLYNSDYWSKVFAPAMVNGKLRMPYARARVLTPLVEKYPRSVLARTWLHRASYDTLHNAKAYRNVLKHWTESADVDLLSSIAGGLSNEGSTIYDPKEALQWILRAERSNTQYTGFRSAENIFGSMGRLDRIMQQKIAILGQLGRMEEAQKIAYTALRAAKDASDKTGIYVSLAHGYLRAKKIDDAERALGMALSITTQRRYADIDSLYQLRKQGPESRDEYIERISSQFRAVEELPALADFEYTTINGRKGRLSDTKGKIVVLDFWFIGCAGCELEHKSLDKFAEKYKGDTNVVLLSVALNNAKTLERYLKTTDPPFPVVADGQAICDKVGVNSFPTHVILDANAKTVVWETGGSETTGEGFDQRVRELKAK